MSFLITPLWLWTVPLMSYYNRLFCMFRFCLCVSISLVVLFYTSLLKAQIYDVNITNNGVDVNVTSMPSNSESFFNGAYDANQLDTTNMQFGDDSPTTAISADGSGGTPYAQALGDFQDYSYSSPPNSTSNNPLTPTLSGRNPLGLSGYRYFNIDGQHWGLTNNHVNTYQTTPLQVVSGDANNNFKVTLAERRILPLSSQKNTFFNYSNFQADIVSAIIGPNTLLFITRLITAINSTPSAADFVFNVPSIFGFNAGFQIVIPFSSVLNGSGDWSAFTPVITVFRSFLALVYYLCSAVFMVRCVIFYQ